VALGFERIRALLEKLENPQEELKTVQVVGTNGKGTTAVALAGALEAAGVRSGAYLSPHVLSYTERIMLGEDRVSEQDFAAVMDEVMTLADRHEVPATQFELLTAGALKLFRDRGVEWACLEAGLGARHDATSVARSELVVLTNVGLDHTEHLGSSVEEIAREKLASLRSGTRLILGTEDPKVVEVALQACEEVGAALVEIVGPLGNLAPATKDFAPYLAHNVRVGIRTAETVLGRSLNETESRGALAARLPGRFEVYRVGGVPVIVDGGHNADGIVAAVEATRNAYGERPLGVVFGALRDKDIGSMLAVLQKDADVLVLTRPKGARAADPSWVDEVIHPVDGGGRRARVRADMRDAVEDAVAEMAGRGGAVLVTGSLQTAAGILGALR
jgi:dihydrofolate synthase/folylpolyglutamate synthase